MMSARRTILLHRRHDIDTRRQITCHASFLSRSMLLKFASYSVTSPESSAFGYGFTLFWDEEQRHIHNWINTEAC